VSNLPSKLIDNWALG